MIVQSIGNSLMVILPDLVGKRITNWFDLVRPLIAFKFQTVIYKKKKIIINPLKIVIFIYTTDSEPNEQYFRVSHCSSGAF